MTVMGIDIFVMALIDGNHVCWSGGAQERPINGRNAYPDILTSIQNVRVRLIVRACLIDKIAFYTCCVLLHFQRCFSLSVASITVVFWLECAGVRVPCSTRLDSGTAVFYLVFNGRAHSLVARIIMQWDIRTRSFETGVLSRHSSANV